MRGEDRNTMGLIKYVDFVLRLQKTKIDDQYKFTIIDRWDHKIVELNYTSIVYFLIGVISIYDSKGVRWNFREHPSEVRTDVDEIIKFLVHS